MPDVGVEACAMDSLTCLLELRTSSFQPVHAVAASELWACIQEKPVCWNRGLCSLSSCQQSCSNLLSSTVYGMQLIFQELRSLF